MNSHGWQENYGWCDDPSSPHYNQFIEFPFAASAEHLWLDSHVYDLLAVIGYNDDPSVAGRGSAIFFHVVNPDMKGTADCISIPLKDLVWVLDRVTPTTYINILPYGMNVHA